MSFLHAVLSSANPAIRKFPVSAQLQAVEAFLVTMMPILAPQANETSSAQFCQDQIIKELKHVTRLVATHGDAADNVSVRSRLSLSEEHFDGPMFISLAPKAFQLILEFLKYTEAIVGKLSHTTVDTIVLDRRMFNNEAVSLPLMQTFVGYALNHADMTLVQAKMALTLLQPALVKSVLKFILPTDPELLSPYGFDFVNTTLSTMVELLSSDDAIKEALVSDAIVHFILTEYIELLRDDLHPCTPKLLELFEALARFG